MARLMSMARILERMFQPSPVSAQASLLRSPTLARSSYNQPRPSTLDPRHPPHYPTDSVVHHPNKVQLTYGVVDDTLNPAHLPDQRSASRIPIHHHPAPPPAANSQLPLQAHRHHRPCCFHLCQVIRGAPATQVIHPDHSKFTRATDN